MKNVQKYKRNYFMPPEPCYDWVKKETVDHAPIWCSVDLRDGNQSLIVPMSLEEKLEFFQFLVKIGFKEIEIGFPAASDTEYEFTRALIEQNLIPDDVTIQVLTQSREHIIKKTFDALQGAKSAVVHLYNSTSVAQREQVFKKSKEEIIQIATEGAELVTKYAKQYEGNFQFEYSPESFTGTEMEFALDICNAVLDIWKPTQENKVIINLPVTVQLSMPHVYASQVEYMCKHLKFRENVIVSLHPHNDRGCAVADSELGLLAGADRIEGTLFGNGERTGNVDIVTMALNLYSQGVEPGLDFSNMPEICEVYERMTRMHVGDRQPYAGALVFAAFSGSHQDAIAKGMKWREEKDCAHWTVPYLPIDPNDVGREYDGDVIRINSQSGKGGIGYLLEQKYGFDLPKEMRENFGYKVKAASDRDHKELLPDEIRDIFVEEYVNLQAPVEFIGYKFAQGDVFHADVTVSVDGNIVKASGIGNGQLDAISNTLKEALGIDYTILTYQENALEIGSKSQACAYVGITASGNGVEKNAGAGSSGGSAPSRGSTPGGKRYFGTGIHTDIMTASARALVSAINNMKKEEK